jgi:hypothetical protein
LFATLIIFLISAAAVGQLSAEKMLMKETVEKLRTQCEIKSNGQNKALTNQYKILNEILRDSQENYRKQPLTNQ